MTWPPPWARRSQGGPALAERIWVLAAVALFSGWHWQQLERPTPSPGELALLAALAAVPAIIAGLGRRRPPIVAAGGAPPIPIRRAIAYPPWGRRPPPYPGGDRS